MAVSTRSKVGATTSGDSSIHSWPGLLHGAGPSRSHFGEWFPWLIARDPFRGMLLFYVFLLEKLVNPSPPLYELNHQGMITAYIFWCDFAFSLLRQAALWYFMKMSGKVVEICTDSMIIFFLMNNKVPFDTFQNNKTAKWLYSFNRF